MNLDTNYLKKPSNHYSPLEKEFLGIVNQAGEVYVKFMGESLALVEKHLEITDVMVEEFENSLETDVLDFKVKFARRCVGATT